MGHPPKSRVPNAWLLAAGVCWGKKIIISFPLCALLHDALHIIDDDDDVCMSTGSRVVAARNRHAEPLPRKSLTRGVSNDSRPTVAQAISWPVLVQKARGSGHTRTHRPIHFLLFIRKPSKLLFRLAICSSPYLNCCERSSLYSPTIHFEHLKVFRHIQLKISLFVHASYYTLV